MKEKLLERIEQLKKERDKFVQEANKQIAYINGRIDELEALLEEEKDE